MYERISEARKINNTVSNEGEKKVNQLFEKLSMSFRTTDENHNESLEDLHGNLRDDEIFDIEM